MSANDFLQEAAGAAATHERILQRTGRIVEMSRQLAALNVIATSVSQSLELSQVLNSAIEQLLGLMELEAGLMFLIDEPTGELVIHAHQGFSEPVIDSIRRLGPREEFIAPVVRTGRPLAGEVPWNDGRPLSRRLGREGFSFFVAAALKSKGNTLGIILLVDHHPRTVDPDSHQFLDSVGSVIGVAIENATLYRSLADLLEESRRQAGR